MSNKRGKRQKYTKEQIKFVSDLVKNGENATRASQQMCEAFDIKYNESIGRHFRKIIEKEGLSKNITRIEDTDEFKKAQTKKYDDTKYRFIITWAQSHTKVNTKFFNNILAYAKHIDAGVHVIAGRYKNPTNIEANNNLKEVEKNKRCWSPELEPYLDANRQKIHKLLTICSDIKIQPTASMPLSGLDGITNIESCIIGHPRIHLKSLPVLDSYPEKVLCSTGSVTIENYTDTKSGKKGEFHHKFGFIIVEIDKEDSDIFHLRQVEATDDGTFYDLKNKVYNETVTEYTDTPLGMVFGDLHIGSHDDVAVETSFKMVKDLNVKKIVLHDIFDGHSINPHEKMNPIIQLQREEDGTNSLKGELKQMVKWFKNKPYEFIGVYSNHDNFLDRWIINEDWRKNNNKACYLKYAMTLASGKAPKGLIPYILEKKTKNVTALGIDDSYIIGDIECGMHGHLGTNGSRGSAIQFKNINIKNITGHTHTKTRLDNHMSVGTLTKLKMGYNHGLSSWSHANVIIYPNGKASHLTIIRGKYTTMY